jgi:hypothetical protein
MGSFPQTSPELVFLSLARNCASTLPLFLRFLSELQRSGLSCAALIGENGSMDETRALILEAAPYNVHLCKTDFLETQFKRLVRMAHGREALLTIARERWPDAQYVCVADLDNVFALPPQPHVMREVIATLSKDPSLFALGASTQPVYYDLLALRTPLVDCSTLYSGIKAAQSNPFTYFRFHEQHLYSAQRSISRLVPLRCTSSFNGMCIYKASRYYRGTYRANDEDLVCEHVTMNASISLLFGEEMLISDRLVLATPPDHGPATLFRFLLRRLRKVSGGLVRTLGSVVPGPNPDPSHGRVHNSRT